MQIGFRLPSIIVASAVLVASEGAQAATPVRDLLSGCQSLERGKTGRGNHIEIPKTKSSLVCWGYMKAMQDLSVWTDENGHTILGSCPPERTTTLDLIRSFVRYGRSHRRELPSNAALAVTKACQQAFACSEEGAR
jgi:hypothetical protein